MRREESRTAFALQDWFANVWHTIATIEICFIPNTIKPVGTQTKIAFPPLCHLERSATESKPEGRPMLAVGSQRKIYKSNIRTPKARCYPSWIPASLRSLLLLARFARPAKVRLRSTLLRFAQDDTGRKELFVYEFLKLLLIFCVYRGIINLRNKLNSRIMGVFSLCGNIIPFFCQLSF